ncbi:MAG: hypothetical protein ACRCZI_11140 [Cetobacterium sp.]
MNENAVDISGLDKAAVLAALYNASKQQGAGFLHERGQRELTVSDARALLSELTPSGYYFDYLHGRVMKIDISGDTLRTGLYNRDVGEGAAERVIADLRAAQQTAAAA